MGNIQVKGVPKELHERARQRARQTGRSLSSYVLELLERDLAHPTLDEWFDRLHTREPIVSEMSSADLVRHAREEREEELDRRLGRR